MPINFPYKDNTNLRKLPCNWHSHPQDANVRHRKKRLFLEETGFFA